MESPSIRESVAGAVWIYVANVVMALGGFIFWVIMAKLSGLKALGIASAIVSAAAIASMLVSAGINIAVIREVASRGLEAFWSALMISLFLGAISSILAFGLAKFLGVGNSFICAVLSFASVISITLTASLVGYRVFRGLAFVAIASSLAKILVGISVASMGMYLVAPLIGYVSYPITSSIAAFLILLPFVANFKISMNEMKRVAMYIYTNYPVVFSSQLPMMLNVYLYALISQKAVPTGALYLAFSITMAISAIPTSLINASLPISIKRGVSSIADSARIGVALATPIIAFIVACPNVVLELIAKGSAIASSSLAILAMSIFPLAMLSASVNELNRVGKPYTIALVGGLRLAALLTTLPPLVKFFGMMGAALSYLISSCVPLPIAAKYLTTYKELLKCWGIASISLAMYFVLGPSVAIAFALAIASTILMKLTNVIELNEVKLVMKTVFSELGSLAKGSRGISSGSTS